MMEVRSPTLQNIGTTRHSDKNFGPEGRNPSVCTGLSLAVPGSENENAILGVGHLPSVSSTPTPLPSAIGGYGSTSTPFLSSIDRNETTTLSSRGTVGGNQSMAHSLPPDIGLSPRIPVVVVGNRTTPVMPWNASTESAFQNLISSREFDSSVPRDGGNANIFRPPVLAASDTKEGDHQLNIATQPISQEDLNNVYNGGETQQVHNNEVGLDNTQLPFAGETQLVNDQEGFDDMVVLQDSVKAPAFAPINSGGMEVLNQDGADALGNGSAPYETKASTGETETSAVETGPNERALVAEVLTVTEHPKLQPYETKALTGETETSAVVTGPHERVLVTEVPTVTEHPKFQPATTEEQLGLTEASEKEGSNKRMLFTEVPTVTEDPEVRPAATGEQLGLTAATGGQLGLTEASKREGFNTPEPQGISQENVASPMEEKLHDRGNEWNLPKDGEAEKDVKDDVNGMAKVLSEKDIQAIKGRNVVKKFGRKNYKGEVVDYDAENQWFKVIYEDDDQEDLYLVEVKEILLTEETSTKTSTAKRKRAHREGGDQDQQPSKSKKRRKDHTETPDKKRRTSRKKKGTPKKKGSAHTKKSQPGKSPRSKSKGLKAIELSELPKSSLETKPDEILNPSVCESSVQSQTSSGGKRKRNYSGVQAGTSIQDEKAGSKAKGAGKKRTGNAKTLTKSSPKKGRRKSTPKKSSAKRKGTRHRSLSKLPREESKVEKVLKVRAGKKRKDTEMPKGKRLKSDASEDQDGFVGKAVEKDFGGILFSGVVTKFNQKTGYYKVKYEDGDQEDLEFAELMAVLVQ